MGSCHSCGKDEPPGIKFKVVCSDCCVKMCDDCNYDDEKKCGCYGKCDRCGCDVNRGSDGRRCMNSHEWLCNNCKMKSGFSSDDSDDNDDASNDQEDDDSNDQEDDDDVSKDKDIINL